MKLLTKCCFASSHLGTYSTGHSLEVQHNCALRQTALLHHIYVSQLGVAYNHTLNQTALLHQIYMSQLGGRVWSYSTLVHWPQCKQSRTTSYNHLCCMLSPRKKQDLAGRHIQHEYTHCQSQQDQHQSLAAPWGTNTSLLAPTAIGEGTTTVQEYTQ